MLDNFLEQKLKLQVSLQKQKINLRNNAHSNIYTHTNTLTLWLKLIDREQIVDVLDEEKLTCMAVT